MMSGYAADVNLMWSWRLVPLYFSFITVWTSARQYGKLTFHRRTVYRTEEHQDLSRLSRPRAY